MNTGRIQRIKMQELSHVNVNDHDLLIELRTEMKGLRADVRDLKDGTSVTLNDHENRLRHVESQGNRIIGIAILSQIILIPLGFFLLNYVMK